MTRNSLFTVAGIILVVIGAVVANFSGFALAEVTGLAVAMYGAGLACQSFIAKAKNPKSWKTVASVACMGLGGFALGAGGLVSQDTTGQVISAAFGIASIIAGLIFTALNRTNTDDGAKKE